MTTSEAIEQANSRLNQMKRSEAGQRKHPASAAELALREGYEIAPLAPVLFVGGEAVLIERW